MRLQPARSLFEPRGHLSRLCDRVTVQGSFQFDHKIIHRVTIGLDVDELRPKLTDHVLETLGLFLEIVMSSDFRLDHQITLADRFEDVAKPIEGASNTMREKHGMDQDQQKRDRKGRPDALVEDCELIADTARFGR